MWEDLPTELVLEVLSYLAADDVCLAGLVCRHWYAVSRDNDLWKRLLSSRLGLMAQQLQPLPENESSWYKEYKRLFLVSSTRCTQAVEGAFTDEVWHVCFSHDGQKMLVSSKDGNVLMFAVDSVVSQCKELYAMRERLVDVGCFHAQYTEFCPNDALFLLSAMESLGSSHATTMICKVEDGTVMLVLSSGYKDLYGAWVNSNWFLAPSIHGNHVEGHYVTLELHYVRKGNTHFESVKKKLFTSRVRSLTSILALDRVTVADPGRRSDLCDMIVLVRRLYQDRAEIASFGLPVNEMDVGLLRVDTCEHWPLETDHQQELRKIDLPGIPSGYSLSPTHESLFAIMSEGFENIFQSGPTTPSALYEINVSTLTMKRKFLEQLPKLNQWCFVFPAVSSQYVAW